MRALFVLPLLALASAGLAVSEAVAQPDRRDVVLGRASGDALGGLNQIVWLMGEDRQVLTVRARKEDLGRGLDWRNASPTPLLKLDEANAPRLQEQREFNYCKAGLRWGEYYPIPYGHWAGERLALAHPACPAGADCNKPVWQLELAQDDNQPLPLRRLLPRASQGLLLHVVAKRRPETWAHKPQLAGLPVLKAAFPKSQPSSDMEWPIEAAARFPELLRAGLDEQAKQQGHANRSVVQLRTQGPPIGQTRYIRYADLSLEEIRSLGGSVASEFDNVYAYWTFLLRLDPNGDADVLQLQWLDEPAEPYSMLWAIQPVAGSPEDCEGWRDAQQQCPARCEARVAEIRANPQRTPSGFGPRRLSLADTELKAECVSACMTQAANTLNWAQRYFGGGREAQQQRLWDPIKAWTGPRP